MNTKIIMTANALFLGALGITFSFFPKEIMELMKVKANVLSLLSLQLLSAFYLAFGTLNWMSKRSAIGGIYAKPLATANLMHYAIGALAFMKVMSQIELYRGVFFALTFTYIGFALLFFYIGRTNPKS